MILFRSWKSRTRFFDPKPIDTLKHCKCFILHLVPNFSLENRTLGHSKGEDHSGVPYGVDRLNGKCKCGRGRWGRDERRKGSGEGLGLRTRRSRLRQDAVSTLTSHREHARGGERHRSPRRFPLTKKRAFGNERLPQHPSHIFYCRSQVSPTYHLIKYLLSLTIECQDIRSFRF